MNGKLAVTGAALALVFAAAAPAMAAVQAPPDTCNIELAYCNIIDDSAHPRFIFGTEHNAFLIGNTSSDQYSAFDQGNGWWWIKNQQNGVQCWNEANNLIVLSSCQSNDPNEEWTWVTQNGIHIIENAAEGPHWAVHCCASDSALLFNNGATDGTNYWNWKS